MTYQYESVTCTECGKRWQLIDFGCAAHTSSCREGYAAQPELDAAMLRHGFEPTRCNQNGYPYPAYQQV